jgi:hypothetical protein
VTIDLRVRDRAGVAAVASPSPSLDPIRLALRRSVLGQEAGLRTWVHTWLLEQLHQGFLEEWPSAAVLTQKHGVPLQDLVDAVVSIALACRSERPPGVIDSGTKKLLKDAADVLARDGDLLTAAWTRCVEADRGRGRSLTLALELLDKAALGWMTEQQFDDLLFTSTDDPLQHVVLVLMRAADTLHHARPTGPAGDEVRIASAVTLRRAAMILAERRPLIPAQFQVPSEAAFADSLSTAETILQQIGTAARSPGRPGLMVERRVAGEFVEMLRGHTRRRHTDHAAPFVALACPRLGRWRTESLKAARKVLYPAQREALGECLPHELPRAARAFYVGNLGRYLRRLLRPTSR